MQQQTRHGKLPPAAHGKRSGASSHAPSNLTAVCLVGALRTFLQLPVQRAFVEHIHHAGYEYFMSTDRQRPVDDVGLAVAPIRAWHADGSAPHIGLVGRPNTPTRDQLPRGRCPRATCNPFRFLLPFARKLAECYYSIQAEEGVRRLRYASVLRLRPDVIFLRPMPTVHPLGGWLGVQLVPGRVLIWDDQISVSRRQDAAAMLLAPSLSYATCIDEPQWRAAALAGQREFPRDWTTAKCRETGDIPVAVMGAAFSVFGGATSWRELPLSPRRWPINDAGREDFCMKRERWVNETAGRATSDVVAFEC